CSYTRCSPIATVSPYTTLFRSVHPEDGDDVLQFLVALEDRLHALGAIVVYVAHDGGGEDAAGGIQRVHRGVNAQLGDLPAQHRGDRKSTRLNSSHVKISYAVFC